MRRIVIAAAALVGTGVGFFWLFAIDAGVNGKGWPPNWHTWTAHVTCPVIPLLGLNNFMNFLAPIFNGGLYAIAAWGLTKVIHRRTAPTA